MLGRLVITAYGFTALIYNIVVRVAGAGARGFSALFAGFVGVDFAVGEFWEGC